MVLRKISEKILIQSISGIQSTDVSIAGGGVAAGDEGRVVFYSEPGVLDEYRILDGRCFPLTGVLTHAREGAKFSPVEVGVFPDGSIVTATINFEGGFQRNFRFNKYHGTTGALLATSSSTPIVLGEQIRLTVNPLTGGAVAQGWQKNHDGLQPRILFDSTFSSFVPSVVSGSNVSAPFVIPDAIFYSSTINKAVSASKFNPSGLFSVFQTPQFGGGTLFSQTCATAAASLSYRDGPVSISEDPVTGEFIVVSQFQTNGITFDHDIQVFKVTMPLDGSPVVSVAPTTIYSSVPADPTHTGLQAGLDLVVLSNQKMIVPLESLDYDGIATVPNSMLLVVDTTLSVLEMIDLGSPGKVRITERSGRIYVLHQEATTNSDVYLTTFSDDEEALPPHAIKLTDVLSGNRDFTSSVDVSYDFGSYTASKYLLSETQSTNPNDTNHPGFFITMIPYLTLGGTGLRTVYAWFTNPTTSLLPNFATIFVNPSNDILTWNYVLQPGNNMVSAALSCTPGLFAKSFVSNSPADFFFYENNGVLSTQLGSAIHLNPNNPTVNRPINPGFGYIVSLNSSFAGLVRTVSITGTAWEN